jgi:mannan endo-1,4-beta-mannosidase
MVKLGVTNLRIMAACEGPESEPYRIKPALMKTPGEYNEAVLQGLDFLLNEMSKREMKAVVCLNNFWPWSGGMAQYLAWAEEENIPYPSEKEGSWGDYMNYTATFYKNKRANKLYKKHIETLIKRKNSYNSRVYLDDPTIMSWQLANEPRGMKKEKRLNRWIKKTAKYIKSLDQNHLVSVGSEGEVIRKSSGNDFNGNHKSKYVDYTTIHLWIQNWAWFDPMKPDSTYPLAWNEAKSYIDKHILLAQKLDKPLVLEEFGISRDYNDHDQNASVYWRDKFFSMLFEYLYNKSANNSGLSGCNVWSWSGLGRPKTPGEMWSRGEEFTGDPPHELQGWYSIYDSDLSTLAIISKFAHKYKEISALDE